jgi:amino acid adenylation domain-containing protein
MMRKEDILVPDFLCRLIKKEKISVFFVTTALFNMIVDEGLTALSGTRKILFGGERVSLVHAAKAWQYLGSERILHVYGPTETTVYATYFPINKIHDRQVTVPIGSPISNTTIYILDPRLQLAAIGVSGEIYIGGAGVSRGYLNNPELTCEKFLILNNMSHKSHMSYITHRSYKTGDLARWLQDGVIEFLGRIDHQVKIRGFRIELGEIESRLLQHDLIEETVVIEKNDFEGGKYLAAYIVSDEELESSELREMLARNLPNYMIPTYFVNIPGIPLTANGKLDRKALPEPELSCSEDYQAPRNDIEKRLVEIWSEVLGIEKEKVSINANFFELGGHSLKATILTSKIHKELNMKVPLAEVFKTPTIRELAGYIRETAEDKYTSMEPGEKKEYYDLSSAQKRLYFLQQMDLESTSYNMPMVLPLGKDIEITKLELTLKKLIARHESFRTSFERVKELPVQKIHPPDNIEFSMDYYEVDETQALQIVSNYIKPFDLGQAPLLRSGVIKLPDNNHTWMVDMHHIISDGTSLTILTEDFLALYSGRELDTLQLQYKDFSQWQNQLFASGKIKNQEVYWLSLYADVNEIPRLDLPTDFKRPEVFTFMGDRYAFMLEREAALQFKRLGARDGATLYMNMLAVLDTLFYKYTGQTDIIIGSGIAGRPHADLQQIVGMFVNSLAMRNYPAGEKTYESFLKEVKNNSIKAFENQDVQFEELVDRLVLERDPSRNPLFDISMVVQNFRDVGEGIGTHKREKLYRDQVEELPFIEPNRSLSGYKNPTTKFDITFFIHEQGEEVHISIEYYTAIFKPRTIKRLASHLKNIITTVIDSPSIRLKDIQMISPEEKEQVLYEFNAPAVEFDLDRPIHELFEEQVDKTPDNVVTIGVGTRFIASDSRKWSLQVTYKKLNETSNQLARYLSRGKGVQPGDPVAILLSPSLHRPVSIIGVLKAGTVYVPIDPAAPLERIKYMIDDAAVSTVISEKKFLGDLNRMQWECNSLHSYLCMDSHHIYEEEEAKKNELMDEELWHHVGETAIDDITGGGWASSYTGEPLSRQEMDEYGDNILKKLEPLLHPGMRVLEIGCASGITMFRIALKVALYYGTDLSEIIIEKNKERVAKQNHGSIKLACLAAHEVHQLKDQQNPFDLVIINSVIQCFHGHNYLRKVISTAIDLLDQKGYLFIGDVMDQGKKDAMVRELTAFKQANCSRDRKYNTKTDFSSELFAAKGFFTDLAAEIEEIESVEFTDKIYTIENELTKFRYDTLIVINKTRKPFIPPNTHGKRRQKHKEKYQDDLEILSHFDAKPLHVNIPSANPAYIIYTSGTTGQPRGVVVEQSSLVNLCCWHNRVYQVSARDNATLYAGFAFDASAWELFPYIIIGASLHIIPGTIKLDIDALNAYYEQHHITIAFLPTQMCEQFMEKDNRSLRVLLTGGDKLRRFVKKNYDLYNNYGPTENTVVTTYYPVEQSLDNIPIGKPLDNTRIYILERESLTPQPIGIPGELCISGTGLARGYLNHPELTAEKFDQDLWDYQDDRDKRKKAQGSRIHKSYRSYRSNISKKIYRTGDLARWRPDGNIQFLGRIDFQVKVRGFRIELGEIENQLLQHDLIREAVVIDQADQEGDNYLCAYIIPAEPFNLSELKDFLLQRVQEYMIPTYFISLDKIPLTSNGKVNRKALPPPDFVSSKDYVAPESDIEKRLVEIWSEILNIEKGKISMEANFFDLGGHSLKATILTSKIHKELKVKIPLAEIFKRQTLGEQAQYINKTEVVKYVEIEVVEKKEYYSLSSAQKGLYYIQEMDPESTAYNMPHVIALEDTPDIMKLEEIFRKLIHRHESLRTSYHMIHEKPVQKIHKEVEFKIEYYDLQPAASLISSFVLPFDLSRAPLLRVGLMELPHTPTALRGHPRRGTYNSQEGKEHKYILMIDMHHIITDGSSQEILSRDFILLNSGEDRPHLKLQYKDYAQWQNKQLQSGELKKQEEYWLNRFKGTIPVLNLPTDYPRTDSLGPEGAVPFEIDKELTMKIQNLVSATGSTLFIFLLAIYTILLSKYTNREDIVVGCPTAGRIHQDLNHIIGLLVNMVAMRNFPASWKTFRQFLKEVKENSIEAFENQGYQFEELMGKLDVPRYLNRNPLTDAVFILQNFGSSSTPQEAPDKPGPHESRQNYEYQSNINAQFDITLNALQQGDIISLVFYYRKNLFKEETIKSKSRHLLNIIKEILDNPDMQLSAINMLDQAEQEEMKNMLGNKQKKNQNNISIPVEPSTGEMEADFDF